MTNLKINYNNKNKILLVQTIIFIKINSINKSPIIIKSKIIQKINLLLHY
jgi:hypothetical protein